MGAYYNKYIIRNYCQYTVWSVKMDFKAAVELAIKRVGFKPFTNKTSTKAYDIVCFQATNYIELMCT